MRQLLSFVFVFWLFSASAQPFNEEHNLFREQLSYCFTVKEEARNSNNNFSTWTTVANYAFGKDRGNMAMIADLSALHPYFRDQVIQLMKDCKAQGIELTIVESFRTRAKQNEYKEMGNGYTRSTAGRSKHQYGLAIDVVPMIDSVAQWHDRALWKKIGLAGEKLGLKWGGRWRHLYDPGHFEWTGGLTVLQLANGHLPPVPHPEKYPCLEEDVKQLATEWNAWEEAQALRYQNEMEASTKE